MGWVLAGLAACAPEGGEGGGGAGGVQTWVLEQTPEGAAQNRLWRVTPAGAEPVALPAGAPLFTDVLARRDADLWLAGEDGNIWRFVAPAAAREGRVILPEPPPAPVVEAVPLPEGVAPANMVALGDGRLLVIGRDAVPSLEALVYDGAGFSPFGGAAPLSRADLSGLARERSRLSAAGEELAALVDGGGGDRNLQVLWWRPNVGAVRSEGRYSAAALVAPGELWAIRDGALGRLEGEALAWVPDPDAPAARQGVSPATLTGGGGEVWMHSNGTIHSRIDGVWTAHAVGQLSAIHSLTWTGPGQVVAGGQNGSVFEVRGGELRPHTGLTGSNIEEVYGVGDQLYVRFRGGFLGFDGRSWGEVSFPDHPDVAWDMVRGVAPGPRYYRGEGPGGPVVLQVSPAR